MHAEGEVLAEEHTADGTRLHARVGAELASAVLPFTCVDDASRNGSEPRPASSDRDGSGS